MSAEVIARAIEFNEADHPRGTGDQGGQFVEKGTGGGSASSPSTRQRYQPPTSKPDRFQRGPSRSGAAAKPAAPLPVGTLKRGADNDPAAVAQLQAMLGELGLGQIAVDGMFGPDTETAVKAAQQKLGLKPTGVASAVLQRKLHDAHTLSPCIDRAQSKVTASAAEYESDEDEADDDELEDDEGLDDDEDDEGEPVTAALGHDVTPGHDQLHHYWTRGKGLARWAESPTPWTTLLANLKEEVPDKPLEVLKKWASRWYIEVFGFSAGSDLARVAHGKPPRGHLVGPG